MSEQDQSLNQLMAKLFVVTPATKNANAPPVGVMRRSAFVPEIRSISEKDRTITFTASTESVDRYGDRLLTRGWKLDAYRRNPVFLWSHRHDQPPIGKTLDVHVEQSPVPALVQKVEFASKETYPFADQIFQLFKGRFLNSCSVGFIPLEKPTPILDEEGRSTGGYEFTSQELLELSAVPLPANPDCVSRAIDAGIITTADATKVFTLQSDEPASARDIFKLIFSMGALSHSVEMYQKIVRRQRECDSVSSVEDLERLFRLG